MAANVAHVYISHVKTKLMVVEGRNDNYIFFLYLLEFDL